MFDSSKPCRLGRTWDPKRVILVSGKKIASDTASFGAQSVFCELDALVPAYAATVLKSQGSEYEPWLPWVKLGDSSNRRRAASEETAAS